MKIIFSLVVTLTFFLNVNDTIAQQNSSSKDDKRIVSFGTTLDPQKQIEESQKLAKKLANPSSPQWKAKGDQLRSYHFPDIDSVMPYRVYVPSTWDGKSKLPLVMFLHGAWNDESSYLDADNKLMLKLAEEHGYLLVSPLGYSKLGGYGTCLLLPALFGKPEEAKKVIAQQTPERWHTLALSEKDVINVLELVLNEYPVDRRNMFLTGHSMGSGGTWYLGAKYDNYFKALAPMSGAFVLEDMYPWERIRKKPVLISEGTKTAAALVSSRLLAEWMKKNNFIVDYKEKEADHPGMVPLVLPDVFNFFDQYRSK